MPSADNSNLERNARYSRGFMSTFVVPKTMISLITMTVFFLILFAALILALLIGEAMPTSDD